LISIYKEILAGMPVPQSSIQQKSPCFSEAFLTGMQKNLRKSEYSA